jgi:serine/threonine protein kinase
MGSLGDVERTTTEIQCLTVRSPVVLRLSLCSRLVLALYQALNHPSIIKLLRVINEPNHVVLVIELLEG